jgi:CysZ protein
MIAQALNRSWQQLLHPKFRSVFLTSIIAAAITLVALTLVLNAYWPESYSFGWEWLDEFGDSIASAGFWTIVMIGSYMLFPGIVTMVMGVLIDKIATAVEEEYYPNRIGSRKVPITDTVLSAAKLTLIMVVANLLALIPYLILLVTTAGSGALALFIVLNGYLLGREYYEMVALRHMPIRATNAARLTNSGKIFMAGCLIAGMFLVPFLNILAPIIGAALMTHVVHTLNVPARAGGNTHE